jgi:hypothetical protein
VGTIHYAGFGMTMIGAAGGLAAQTTFAQLLSGPLGTPEASLQLASPTTTFRTGGAQGNIALVAATLAGVAKDAASATLEMVAWDNTSGKYATWETAKVAWEAGLIAGGKSGTFTAQSIGGDLNTPPVMYIPSFNLYIVPEPTTFALAGLGLAAMLVFRRRS